MLDKDNKKKKFLNIVLLLISLIIVVFLSMYLLDTTGKVNQGYFRINDLVISSTVSVEDKEKAETPASQDNAQQTEVEKESINSLADLKLSASQNNEILFLIAKTNGIEAKDIYIDNVKVDYPVLYENMYLYQSKENKIDLKTQDIRLDIVKEDKDNQYLIKLNIDNLNFIKDAAMPNSDVSAVKFDGTILNVLNIKSSDIMFKISFDLNITDSSNKLNTCKVNLNLPSKLIVTNGVSIMKENVSKFPFIVK